MASTFLQYTQKITQLFKNYPTSSSQSTQQIKQTLLNFIPIDEEEIAKFNVFLQKQIKGVLMQIMTYSNLNKLAQIISLICEVSLQHKQTSSNNRAKYIKQSLAIIIVQDVLQCLGINDLKQILPTISEKVSNFGQLQMNDQNRLLRVINYLLKRISKTEDYLIRGQLQFTLTKILSICHDSGFNYRISTVKGIQIAQNQQNQYEAVFSSQDITYQFYKQFWQLQKYLMDPNQLTQQNKSSNQQTPKKPISNFKPDPLIFLRLKQIQKVLNDVVNYMNKHPCSQNQTPLLSQPIKFLTNTHLLQFQLSDQYFRKIILVQISIFTFTLKHLKPTGNILKGVMLTESQRQIINKIQNTAQKQLEILEKKSNYMFSQKNSNQILPLSILEMMKCFFVSQLQWIQLKDHWKQKKKSFLRLDTLTSDAQQKSNKNKDQVDYNKKIAQINEKIKAQMNIQGQTLLKFLKEPCIPHIVTTPTQTSFSCYWSQGKVVCNPLILKLYSSMSLILKLNIICLNGKLQEAYTNKILQKQAQLIKIQNFDNIKLQQLFKKNKKPLNRNSISNVNKQNLKQI